MLRGRWIASLVLSAFAPTLVAQTTLHASLSTAGVDADKHCDSPAISADGRFVVFDSTTKLLDPADTSTTRDVFLRDLVAGTTVLISYATDGHGGDRASSIGRVTLDGNLVAFESAATNLVSGDLNNKSDVFVRDVASGSTARMSVSSSGRGATMPAPARRSRRTARSSSSTASRPIWSRATPTG